jgi:hypothetical protein
MVNAKELAKLTDDELFERAMKIAKKRQLDWTEGIVRHLKAMHREEIESFIVRNEVR